MNPKEKAQRYNNLPEIAFQLQHHRVFNEVEDPEYPSIIQAYRDDERDYNPEIERCFEDRMNEDET